ncbi:NAD(P)H-dependent flavin oxidoreductase [Roseomonas xinghualingensis]|uniref:NAD(P)H-dependent flavin oxidoreductase n=1 Tax=Roseomonas xinghualingensis TaxID=2986475 RepID=UPI0021F207BA|nr:nitronate monooxygenase [Roseomonas sp. SXEYE001]MCV4209681.1 nitronate monooxygenase [Roseomonas sp. SXEYE001]
MHPPVFRTRITELFGIRHPILAGGLMWLSDANYVAAVVRAGGMAFLTPRSFPETGAFARELVRCRELTEGLPFGVNLNVSKVEGHNLKLDEWLDLSLRAGVRHFETVGRAPGDLIHRIHAAGGIAIHKCPLLRHAFNAERAGADAICIIGVEAGGHPGAAVLGSMVVAPMAARQLSVPLVIGGGIGTGDGILAALASGAEGVVLGSRLLAAEEVWAHPAYKERIVAAEQDSTLLTFSGAHPMGSWRVLENETSREVLRRETAGARDYAAFSDLIGGTKSRDHAYRDGEVERGMLSCGPAAAFTRAVEPMETIIDTLISEAVAARRRLERLDAMGSVDA